MVLGKVGVAVCTLNQHCLDFESNLQRILSSIEQAIDFGASIRIGPELEVTGYGCEDAFYEMDTVYHSWQVIAEILKKNYRNILINIGMPVVMESTLYNCIVAILNSKIVYIRAKNRLAINGNYRSVSSILDPLSNVECFFFQVKTGGSVHGVMERSHRSPGSNYHPSSQMSVAKSMFLSGMRRYWKYPPNLCTTMTFLRARIHFELAMKSVKNCGNQTHRTVDCMERWVVTW